MYLHTKGMCQIPKGPNPAEQLGYQVFAGVLVRTGNGVCDENSNCDCFDGFTGGVCDCTTDNSTCMGPGVMGEVELCSGEGQCICGLCICNNYSVNFGNFCEQCLVSSTVRLDCGIGKCAPHDLCPNMSNQFTAAIS